MSYSITQLLHDKFKIEAFTLKNAYLICINKQHINAQEKYMQMGQNLEQPITIHIAQHKGSHNMAYITQYNCIRSPITRTLFLLKEMVEHISEVH